MILYFSANVLHAYDPSWQIEGFPVWVGSKVHFQTESQDENPEEGWKKCAKQKQSFSSIKRYKMKTWTTRELLFSCPFFRWLNQTGVGHLAPKSSKFDDHKKFLHLLGGLMDKVENQLGNKKLAAQV